MPAGEGAPRRPERQAVKHPLHSAWRRGLAAALLSWPASAAFLRLGSIGRTLVLDRIVDHFNTPAMEVNQQAVPLVGEGANTGTLKPAEPPLILDIPGGPVVC